MNHPHSALTPFWRVTLTGAILVSLAAATVAAYYRIPWSDEGWFSSASYNLAHHGFLGTTVIDPTEMHLTRIAQRTYWVMPLYLLGQALWLKLFPATLFAVRMFTILWVPIAVSSFYRFLWRVTSSARVAALAASLLALSFIFIDNSGFARPDLMCCALGLCGLCAFVEWRETHFYRALIVSNTFVAASGLTHPNGVFHLLGLAILILYYDRRRLTVAALGAAALPYAVFGAAWGAYILQDPRAFADQIRGNGTYGRWLTTLNPLRIVWNEISLRYFPAFGLVTKDWALLKIPALGVYLAAIAGALIQPGFRRQRSTRLLLLLLAAYFAALSIFNQKLTYYLIHILPWYIALTAAYLYWLWDYVPSWRMALAAVVAALAVVETGGILMKSMTRSPVVSGEQAAILFALQHAGRQDRIVGTAALSYGFGFDPRLLDDPRLGLLSGQTPDMVIVDPIYRDLYDSWKTVRVAEDHAIAERLAGYRLAFDNGVCQVYLRPKGPALR